MGKGSGVTRGDRRLNARKAGLRALVPAANAVIMGRKRAVGIASRRHCQPSALPAVGTASRRHCQPSAPPAVSTPGRHYKPLARSRSTTRAGCGVRSRTSMVPDRSGLNRPAS